jgi:hypothetical protein
MKRAKEELEYQMKKVAAAQLFYSKIFLKHLFISDTHIDNSF